MVIGGDGYLFCQLDRRLQARYWRLVSEHTHTVNAAAAGLSALPSTAQPFANTLAMCRFVNNDAVSLPALIEPAQEAVREAVAKSTAPVALAVHDWCMFNFNAHTSKKDRIQRSHEKDLGYDLGSVLVVDASDGRPLGPMEFRLRTAHGTLTTRPGGAETPPGHIDELADVMAASERWNLPVPLVHVIDREADSVGHYRSWQAAGHRFVVRADAHQTVQWQGQDVLLSKVLRQNTLQFQDVLDDAGRPLAVSTPRGSGRVQVWETKVVLTRPAKTTVPGVFTAGGHKKKIEVPGPPLPLRLILTRVVKDRGVVVAEWCLYTNVDERYASATVAAWYAYRWQIESYHKLMKSAGMNAESWEQESGEALAKRLMIASMACLTVWQLRRDDSADALKLRAVLVRLSGRQMKWGKKDTAPSLLAGLEKLLAIHDLLAEHDLQEILNLARSVLPTLFRSG